MAKWRAVEWVREETGFFLRVAEESAQYRWEAYARESTRADFTIVDSGTELTSNQARERAVSAVWRSKLGLE